VRALAAEVSRRSEGIAARWPDGVPDLLAAETRLAAGVTALEGEPLLDGAELLRGGRALGAAVEAVEPAVGRTMLAIVERLEGLDERSLDELARAALAGAWEPVVSLASILDLDEYALFSVADYAARPPLVAAVAAGARQHNVSSEAPYAQLGNGPATYEHTTGAMAEEALKFHCIPPHSKPTIAWGLEQVLQWFAT